MFIHLFDADGGVTRNSADEWDQIDVADVLHREIGLPEPESRVIAEKFRVVANSKGHEQPRPMTPIPGILLVGGILVVIAIGLWTIGSWIFG